MRSIHDAHVTEPGLAVVEVTAADDETAFAIQELLATRCAVAAADRTAHEPGEPGVRLRCFLDLRSSPTRDLRRRFRFPRATGRVTDRPAGPGWRSLGCVSYGLCRAFRGLWPSGGLMRPARWHENFGACSAPWAGRRTGPFGQGRAWRRTRRQRPADSR
ncbi:DUF6207 family protein [Streptomyces sp. NPDC020731]|uniref:DUF6207 family protein n=1 Tax=Streptomyces sp. NPDC020731 TaxID=3365085 RepID=UPI0037AEB875